jgi:uncharacterized protein with HEPN domain
MRGKIGDKVRLQHILDAIIEIETYSLNTDFSGFMKNSMMRFACIKQMGIIKLFTWAKRKNNRNLKIN